MAHMFYSYKLSLCCWMSNVHYQCLIFSELHPTHSLATALLSPLERSMQVCQWLRPAADSKELCRYLVKPIGWQPGSPLALPAAEIPAVCPSQTAGLQFWACFPAPHASCQNQKQCIFWKGVKCFLRLEAFPDCSSRCTQSLSLPLSLSRSHLLSLSLSYFLFFYKSLHFSPLSLSSYWCTDHPHLDKHLKSRRWASHTRASHLASYENVFRFETEVNQMQSWLDMYCHFSLVRVFPRPADRTNLQPECFCWARGVGKSKMPASILN